MSNESGAGGGICKIFTIIFMGFITFFATCVSIASFWIGYNNWHVTCDDSGFMPLPIWVVTIGAISLVVTVGATIIYCIRHGNPVKFLSIFAGVAGFFIIPFAVMGTMLMAKNSTACYEQAYSLWAISLTALVLDWLVVIIILGLIIIGVIMLIKAFCTEAQRA